MRFAEADNDGGHFINGYEPGRILIDGHSYHKALIVSPDRVISDWGPASAGEITEERFAALLELGPQVIVVGTGDRQVFPNPRIYSSALEQGIGVEIMDTGAACRTYNILMAEGRTVAAGLIPC